MMTNCIADEFTNLHQHKSIMKKKTLMVMIPVMLNLLLMTLSKAGEKQC